MRFLARALLLLLLFVVNVSLIADCCILVTSVNQKSDVKNAQSITDLPKTIAQMADPTNMKSVSSAGSPLTSNGACVS